MKRLLLLAVILVLSTFKMSAQVITSDVTNFWTAYDQIGLTKDTIRQHDLLNSLFLSKGTPGLKAIMQVRGYTSQSYLDAIRDYPLFWSSVRANTLKAGDYAGQIAADIQKLKVLYPELKPAKIYFTMGALRTGGTTLDSMVLIGSEIAMADEHTVSSEFPPNYAHLQPYFKSKPLQSLVFNNVHEYVHTQQKNTVGNNLLAQSMLEGVAEFMAVKATGQASVIPAMSVGRGRADEVKQAFATQMFNPFNGFWLYSNAENKFGVRDLGYYVGYAICESYYAQAKNKQQAVKDLIELDYNNETALEKLVNRSGYFKQSTSELRGGFEQARPVVTVVKPFSNHDDKVDTAVRQITIEFSAPMDQHFRNFELGPLGADHLLQVKSFLGFSADGRSVTIGVALKQGTHYQLVVGDGFRSVDGFSLKPYLIDFKTAGQ